MKSNFIDAFAHESELIKELIIQGNFEEAVERLDMFKDFVFKQDRQDLDGLKFRIHRLKREEHNGGYTREELRVQRKQLSNSLQYFVGEFRKSMELKLRMGKLPAFLDTVLKEDGLERMLTASTNLQPISFLRRGAEISSSVCFIRSGNTVGTGFMVANGYLMTCQHVLMSAESAAAATIEFQVWDGREEKEKRVCYKLDHTTYISSPHGKLDFVMVKPREMSMSGGFQENIAVRKSLALNPDFSYSPELEDQPLFVIQHPGGDAMHIGFQSQGVLKIDRADLYHNVNTKKGSSGAPILDSQLNVVAVHNAGLGKLEGGFPIGPNGELVPANRGSLIRHIMRHVNKVAVGKIEW